MPRPPFVRHVTELASSRETYPGDDEPMSIGTPLSRPLGLTRMGIHHERLPPGSRTSWPHAESLEEELAYVLEGTPDVWIDGEVHRLRPGDAIAFVPGTGIAHTFINDTVEDAVLLVVGEKLAENRIHYPFRPDGYQGMKPENRWLDVPERKRGAHDGLPSMRRKLTTSRPLFRTPRL
jgi:uncharacterized cupin superfamily protein